jgi:hypothetical protein
MLLTNLRSAVQAASQCSPGRQPVQARQAATSAGQAASQCRPGRQHPHLCSTGVALASPAPMRMCRVGLAGFEFRPPECEGKGRHPPPIHPPRKNSIARQCPPRHRGRGCWLSRDTHKLARLVRMQGPETIWGDEKRMLNGPSRKTQEGSGVELGAGAMEAGPGPSDDDAKRTATAEVGRSGLRCAATPSAREP